MTASFRELLVAISGSAGALTGLLFVAMSVTPRRQQLMGPRIIHQVRAAAAILAFTNALAVSLFSLVPGTNLGVPAFVLGISGILFTAASARSLWTSDASERQQRHQLSMLALLLAIFGTEFVAGLIAEFGHAGSGARDAIGYALVASVIFGISRAWEFVGDIDTGPSASLAVLLGIRQTALPDDGDEAGASDRPAQSPPAQSPPAQSPPAQNPPAQNPPAQNPPAQNPPAQNPPAQSPPAQNRDSRGGNGGGPGAT